MQQRLRVAQLILRLALGVGFLQPVADRLGWLGPAGAAGVSWGDWTHFVAYTNTLVPFAPQRLANVLALLATTAEGIFGVCLIVGAFTRVVSIGAAALTFTFGCCMTFFIGCAAAIAYPVFVFTGAALLLSCAPEFKWGLDHSLLQKQKQ